MFNITFYNASGAKTNRFNFSTTKNCSALCNGNIAISGALTLDLSNAVDGSYCFNGCTNMTGFVSNMAVLKTGTCMFQGCTKLTFFESPLENLEDGTSMFASDSALVTFKTNTLSKLITGSCMFQSCAALPSFSYDLSKLTTGTSMFKGCTSLETFISMLPSLNTAAEMFSGCKLSSQSLFYIINTLPTYTSGSHPIMFGINALDTDEDRLRFAQELKYSDWASLQSAFTTKGWTPSWQYNASAAQANTLSMFNSASPIWFKLEEVTDSNASYELVSEEGDETTEKRYNCSWFHSGADTEGYEYFGSFLEAFGYHGVIPVEYKEY